jgi:hypothetical protein
MPVPVTREPAPEGTGGMAAKLASFVTGKRVEVIRIPASK